MESLTASYQSYQSASSSNSMLLLFKVTKARHELWSMEGTGEEELVWSDRCRRPSHVEVFCS
jgi:hypothetical protein